MPTTKVSGNYGTTEIECELSATPHLVVTREILRMNRDGVVSYGDGFSVTHDITGYAISPQNGRALVTKEQALLFAAELGKLPFPWDKIRGTVSWQKAADANRPGLWRAWWLAQGTKVDPDSICCARHAPLYRGERISGTELLCPECGKKWKWVKASDGDYWEEVA
jgi:hypothetical protein